MHILRVLLCWYAINSWLRDEPNAFKGSKIVFTVVVRTFFCFKMVIFMFYAFHKSIQKHLTNILNIVQHLVQNILDSICMDKYITFIVKKITILLLHRNVPLTM